MSEADCLFNFPAIQGVGVPCHVVLGRSEGLFLSMLILGGWISFGGGSVVGVLSGARQPPNH